MKKLLFSAAFGFVCSWISAQYTVTGTVIDEQAGMPLAGILITPHGSGTASLTDREGRFSLQVRDPEIKINFSGAGYIAQEVKISLPLQASLRVILIPKTATIEEITLKTGYQQIPKERATGAFSTVNSNQLSKQVTTNIMDRLPAVASGVLVDQTTNDTPQLMVRGLSSLRGPKNPLIILDDFPYEGNLANINPEMVESVTVLKDAAASSIWGARAANGVIVITTRKGKFGQPFSVDFTANTTMSDKPELNYIRQMSSSDFIDVEKELFSRGYYNSAINSTSHPVLTPVVDLLNQVKKGQISAEDAEHQIALLRQADVRDQYRKYMYSPSLNQQYALNISGGSPKISWTAGLGYDKNSGNLSEQTERTNFRLQNTWKPTGRLSFSAGVIYADLSSRSGRTGYGGVRMSGQWQVPYLQFADAEGRQLVVPSIYDQRYKESLAKTGLLDWNYYPLTDWQHSVSESLSSDLLLNAALQYKIFKGLEAEVRYQFQRTDRADQTLHDEKSYTARRYVNNFAYYDAAGILKFRVPKGGILDRYNILTSVNNLRGQLNYRLSSEAHEVAAIAGAEVRATEAASSQTRDYGYNVIRKSAQSVDYLNPYPQFVTGASDFITNMRGMNERNTNFVSLYVNAAYTYAKKYTISGSIRRDASNLFGLNTNDQWNPFWSAGLAWKVSDESFYPSQWLPTLKLRGSYGFSGNIDPAMVAVTTIIYDTSPSTYTGTGMARIDQFYNPNLRWETIRMINMGLDFTLLNNRVTGSFDFFSKKGSNLFGPASLDYTTGIFSMLMNVAGMKGHGVDVELRTQNLSNANFQWNTLLNFSTYKDEVTDYYVRSSFANNYVSTSGSTVLISGKTGLPVYSIFAYKWAGLDPQTGDPRGYLNGEVSTDYTAITGSEKGIEELKFFGSAVPTTYGSLINTLAYRRFSLELGLTYKFGYWFRRNSIQYTQLLSDRVGHSDYEQRWQHPGDEAFTDVPSLIYTTNSPRDQFYSGSEVLVEKGDHVRFQYLNLGFDFPVTRFTNLPFNSLRLYGAVSNLGILWQANRSGLDPDHSFGINALKPVRSYSLGFNLKF
ncbi:SusC/RagA family TonB-linked outer membrane protein [Kaistella daneshvariae]|nr:SusC/RagA family TonB-linked outer membrane protein [Kaistella daneshvariae]